MSRPECRIEECEAPSKTKGMCNRHYLRWWKHGDPNVVKKGGPPKGSPQRGGWKTSTKQRPRGHSSPGSGPKRRDGIVTCSAVHKRLVKDRGRAANYDCVDCGKTARDWSYDNADPNELIEVVKGTPRRYSLLPEHYAPRCAPCHRLFDMAELRNQTQTNNGR